MHATMRSMSLLICAAMVLTACATPRPDYGPDRSWTYICYPGSAIKRKAPPGAAFPEWMVQERGSCLRR